MRFEWDSKKNERNIKQHGLDFLDADLFDWGTAITIEDARLNYGETRFVSFGYANGRLTVMVHTKRSKTTRIISWRKANAREQQRY